MHTLLKQIFLHHYISRITSKNTINFRWFANIFLFHYLYYELTTENLSICVILKLLQKLRKVPLIGYSIDFFALNRYNLKK